MHHANRGIGSLISKIGINKKQILRQTYDRANPTEAALAGSRSCPSPVSCAGPLQRVRAPWGGLATHPAQKSYMLANYQWFILNKINKYRAVPLGFGLFILACLPVMCLGQLRADTLREKRLFFPYPMTEKNWYSSLGLTLTKMPQEITEEVQIRVPAIDFHVLRNLGRGFYLDGRINFELLQNHLSIGPRYSQVINQQFSFSVGDDIAWWFGFLNISEFQTRASGWLNYPNFSLGYRMHHHMLLTLKSEWMLNLYYQSKVGSDVTSTSHRTYAGWTLGIYLEQPLYRKANFLLGLRAIHSNFFWETWSLFEPFEPTLFFPEIIIGIPL